MTGMYKPEVKASKLDKRLQSYDHLKFCTCFHIDFLLPMSGAAAYLLWRRRLLAKKLTTLHCDFTA